MCIVKAEKTAFTMHIYTALQLIYQLPVILN